MELGQRDLEEKKNIELYGDIIDLPHHVSRKRARMPLETRAAQFLPFAALTGYDAAVEETARLTDARMELDESRKSELNEKMLLLQECLAQRPAVRVTFFQKDERKEGGAYITLAGTVKKIDQYENVLILTDGTRIRIEDVAELESDFIKSSGVMSSDK